ncbi:MAG: sulfur carrier protein [Nocardioidaceae bacterium]|jgi:sulfur carrier protein|nr:sulfur carrier protein [Nocardioidaceae bacterium]
MNITVNGTPERLVDGTTLAALMSARALPATGIAAAVNGDVVRAAIWAETVLTDQDAVEIVTAKQGG